jgi:N-acetylmuramoyl-L-alanine amidase
MFIFSFLIGGDGNVYEGRGWNVVGAHTGGYNTVGYGYCFIGDFMNLNPNSISQDAYLQLAQVNQYYSYLFSI